MLFDVDEEGEGDAMKWSMNGGEIVAGGNGIDIEEGEVVYGAAGVAVSPRVMRGRCCECGHEGEGLGLYVIDEVEECDAETEGLEDVEDVDMEEQEAGSGACIDA